MWIADVLPFNLIATNFTHICSGISLYSKICLISFNQSMNSSASKVPENLRILMRNPKSLDLFSSHSKGGLFWIHLRFSILTKYPRSLSRSWSCCPWSRKSLSSSLRVNSVIYLCMSSMISSWTFLSQRDAPSYHFLGYTLLHDLFLP